MSSRRQRQRLLELRTQAEIRRDEVEFGKTADSTEEMPAPKKSSTTRKKAGTTKKRASQKVKE